MSDTPTDKTFSAGQTRPILFLDRDGVVLVEPPGDYQLDRMEETFFMPGAITALSRIADELNYYKVMITNQDGLGTEVFPEASFYPIHHLMLRTLEGEGFVFDEMHVDRTYPKDNQPTRKPGTGLLEHLMNNDQFDMANSFMVGDRWSDIQLAKNLGCKAIYIKSPLHDLTEDEEILLRPTIATRRRAGRAVPRRGCRSAPSDRSAR